MVQITEQEILSLPNDLELGRFVRKKYREQREVEESKFTEYDRCVICGKLSPYTLETHIDNRIGYIEGGGQGCFQPNKCDRI